MTILYSDDSGQVIWPETDLHDPDSKKYYYIMYRPPVRLSSQEYIKGISIVIPSTPNGCIYECVSGGISSLTEPTWGTVEGGTTDDGDVKWKCKPANVRLMAGDVITTSTWTGPSWVTLANIADIIDNRITRCKVTAMIVPTGTTTLTLTNHITVTRASGITEEFDKSLIITIADL
jgi:hypothetical protein